MKMKKILNKIKFLTLILTINFLISTSALSEQLKSIVVEGIISIHAREHPILIREKLMTFVPSQYRYIEND